MQLKYDNGKLSFELVELIECMSDETKHELIEMLACDTKIIEHIAAQILDGWTEGGMRGGRLCGVDDAPSKGLDWAIREVAKRSGDAAKKEIERLESGLKREMEYHQKTRASLFAVEERLRLENNYR